MIPFQELNNQTQGVPPEILEKDYVINWLLAGICQTSLNKELVFYGGTAIKKMYYPDFRFSEDLDFLSDKEPHNKHILKALDASYDFIQKKANINFSTNPETVIYQKGRLQLFIQYDGFIELTLPKQIKLDIIFNQKPIESPVQKNIIWVYTDAIPAKILAYSLEALAAEKISAILDLARKEPRDLFDLDYLLKHSKLDKKKTLKLIKTKFGFRPPLPSLLAGINNTIYKQRWEIRLKNQISRPGKIEKTIIRLEENLKKLYYS